MQGATVLDLIPATSYSVGGRQMKQWFIFKNEHDATQGGNEQKVYLFLQTEISFSIYFLFFTVKDSINDFFNHGRFPVFNQIENRRRPR
jgi:hypothetical protein